MASNVSRGARAKARTKAWLIARGYQVADLEKVYWLFKAGARIPIKKDQLGCDLLAVSAGNVLFIQVKSGRAAIGGTFPDARRTFAQFTFPAFTKQLVIAWPPRARVPRIVRCQGVTHGETPLRSPSRPPVAGSPRA